MPDIRPKDSEYAPFFETYIRTVPEADVQHVLRSEAERTVEFLEKVPHATETQLHSPYTWTFRQVVGHLVDAERVFAYRALRIGRGDATPLASFDEHLFVTNGLFNRLSLKRLIHEYKAVRHSTILLFANFDNECWSHRGTVNQNEVTVRALAYMIAGHERHHMGILRKRLEHAESMIVESGAN